MRITKRQKERLLDYLRMNKLDIETDFEGFGYLKPLLNLINENMDRIVDENKLFDAGLELAEVFLQKSPLGLRMTKEAINLTMDSPSLEMMVQYENRTQAVLGLSKDLAKGASAFLQKRKPKYGLR